MSSGTGDVGTLVGGVVGDVVSVSVGDGLGVLVVLVGAGDGSEEGLELVFGAVGTLLVLDGSGLT